KWASCLFPRVLTQEFSEPERFSRRKECKQGSLILGKSTKQRAKEEGNGRMEWGASGEQIHKLPLLQAPDAGLECPQFRAQLATLLIESFPKRLRPGVADRIAHEPQNLLGRLFEGNVLKPALDLRPFLAAAGRNLSGVTINGLVKDRHEDERSARAGR